jgi:iron complex transport system substrate-binding protein
MRVRGTLAALAALTVLVGCGSTEAGEGDGGAAASGDGAFPVSIEHTFGTTTIEQQPERVVVLGWSAQDVVYSLGLAPVGMPSYSYGGGDDGVLPWDDEYFDAAETTLLDTADGPPLEDIAALRPDVILAPYEGFDAATYEDLSKIAPTVAYPGEAWTTPWDEQTRIIGQALGKSAEAEKLIDDTNAAVQQIADEHPEFADLTFAYTSMGAESLYLYLGEDPRVQLIENLGFALDPSVDTLAGGGEWDEAMTRANAYLDAGADVIFMLGLSDEDKVKRALDEINGKVSVISSPASVPLKRLAELGISRVSFGPFILGLTLAHLQAAATQLTKLGDYPEELGFKY